MKDYSDDKLHILLIEEQQEVLEPAASALTAANYSVSCCTNAEQVNASVENTRPDMIISAASLTGINSHDLCNQIKLRHGLESTPIMFLSSGQIPDIIRRHDQTGGCYYLRKPFDPSVLVELVDKALRTPALAGN